MVFEDFDCKLRKNGKIYVFYGKEQIGGPFLSKKEANNFILDYINRMRISEDDLSPRM